MSDTDIALVIPTDLAQRVANGSAYLTRTYPGWYECGRFDTEIFDMESPGFCVLAQASGQNYYNAFDKNNANSISREYAIYCGFFLTDPEADDPGYYVLTDLWLDEIRRLRNQQ